MGILGCSSWGKWWVYWFYRIKWFSQLDFPAHFTPAVEIGWRLAYDFWNKGYATEGAKAVLNYGFETIGLDEIVSFTKVDFLEITLSQMTSIKGLGVNESIGNKK